MSPSRPSLEQLVNGIEAGDRGSLARAITLAESRLETDQELAQELMVAVSPRVGAAVRVGLTGVPGAGKSTTIEALGLWLIAQGHRVAVLVIDPSSSRTGGSILGGQDAHAAVVAGTRGLYPPLTLLRGARRRGVAHAGGDAAV